MPQFYPSLDVMKHDQFYHDDLQMKHEDLNVARVHDDKLDDYQYQDFSIKEKVNNYVSDVIIDPDGQLSNDQRRKFQDLCNEYTDVITPKPGKYNGSHGYLNNSINFTNRPPPNKKVYVPNYSPEMMTTLAEKMDKLINWGSYKDLNKWE